MATVVGALVPATVFNLELTTTEGVAILTVLTFLMQIIIGILNTTMIMQDVNGSLPRTEPFSRRIEQGLYIRHPVLRHVAEQAVLAVGLTLDLVNIFLIAQYNVLVVWVGYLAGRLFTVYVVPLFYTPESTGHMLVRRVEEMFDQVDPSTGEPTSTAQLYARLVYRAYQYGRQLEEREMQGPNDVVDGSLGRAGLRSKRVHSRRADIQ